MQEFAQVYSRCHSPSNGAGGRGGSPIPCSSADARPLHTPLRVVSFDSAFSSVGQLGEDSVCRKSPPSSFAAPSPKVDWEENGATSPARVSPCRAQFLRKWTRARKCLRGKSETRENFPAWRAPFGPTSALEPSGVSFKAGKSSWPLRTSSFSGLRSSARRRVARVYPFGSLLSAAFEARALLPPPPIVAGARV